MDAEGRRLICMQYAVVCFQAESYAVFHNIRAALHTGIFERSDEKLGQPFFYMMFACCVNVCMVSEHTSSM